MEIEDFKHYIKLAVFAVVGLIIATVVWQTVTKNKVQQTEAASVIYQAMLQASNDAEDTKAKQHAAILVNKYMTTPYAKLAALLQAKYAVAAQEYPVAEDRLQWVIDNGADEIVDIATTRLARLLIVMQQEQRALDLLDARAKKSAKFAALFASIKGDIYTVQQNPTASKNEYLAAKSAAPRDVPLPLLDLKLSDL